jgi:hypothetical protein
VERTWAGLPEEQINTGELPEVRGWDDAKQGVFYRPIKQQSTLRLDAEMVDGHYWYHRSLAFKASVT